MIHFFYYRGTDASAISFNLPLLSLQFQIHFNLQKLWTKIVFSSLIYEKCYIHNIFITNFKLQVITVKKLTIYYLEFFVKIL